MVTCNFVIEITIKYIFMSPRLGIFLDIMGTVIILCEKVAFLFFTAVKIPQNVRYLKYRKDYT